MTSFALVLTLATAQTFYLTCAQQNWLRAPWPRWLRWMTIPAACLALTLWCHTAGAGAGVAAVLVTAMLVWTLAPYAGWWWDVHVRHRSQP